MRSVKVIWIGGLGSAQCVGEKIKEVIDTFTSEHDGEVKVVVICENTTLFLGKQPFLHQNNLSCIRMNYILLPFTKIAS